MPHSFINEENCYLPGTVDAKNGVLLDVVGAGASGENGDLRSILFGMFLLELMHGILDAANDLLCVGNHQQHIGLGIGLSGKGLRIGENDASSLGDEVFAVGDAHQPFVLFPDRSWAIAHAISPEKCLHRGTCTPEGIPSVLRGKLFHAVAELGLVFKIDENASHVLELLDKGDGIAVFLLDGLPSVRLQVDVLEHRLGLFDDRVSHLGENLFFLGRSFV